MFESSEGHVGEGGSPAGARSAALGLAWLSQYGCSPLLRLLPRFGVEAVWAASAGQLAEWGVSPSAVARFLVRRDSFRLHEAEQSIQTGGLRFIPFGCRDYPTRAIQLTHPPAGLFVRGSVRTSAEIWDAPKVAIVGTRRATRYGSQVALAMAKAFVDRGVVVVSGLALGIDGCAHRAALDAGGCTIAVLGCGVDVVYPARHRGLYERVGHGGLLLSEYPPGTRPARWTFPHRNRVLAALGDAVLVVEGSKTSGTLHTVDAALELGRPVFSVPGPIIGEGHQGCNWLIYDGAIPAVDPAVTVEEFLLRTRIEREGRWRSGCAPASGGESPADDPVTSLQQRVLRALSEGIYSLEGLISVCGSDARQTAAAVTGLELLGRVDRAGGGYRIRAP